MDAQQLEEYRKRLHSRAPMFGARLRRAIKKLARDGTVEAVDILKQALTKYVKDNELERVIAVLRAFEKQPAIDAVCAVWQETRDATLAALIQENRWIADAPPGCRVLTALLCGQEDVITKGGKELVEPLVEACEDKDAEISGRACEAGSRLRDEAQRAVFFFLTGQWEKYEVLDFDHRLLRAFYESAEEGLRQRIRNHARASGRLEWVEVATGGRQARRLGEMTDSEWDTTLSLLKEHGRWEEMWQLAQRGPARWSARLLHALAESGWNPPEAERSDFAELVELARRWQEPDTTSKISLLKTLKGHSDWVRCLAITPDGGLLASGSNDDTVRLWSLPDGRLLKTLEGHSGWVTSLAITPDGRLLASGTSYGTVPLWSLPDGRLLKTLEGHGKSVGCLAITPDGWVLASGSKDKTVRLWSLPDGRLLKTLEGHSGWVTSLAITPDGRVLASGSKDKTVRLWSLPDGRRLLNTLKGHSGEVTSFAITPDGWVLASGSNDHTVRLWSSPVIRLAYLPAEQASPKDLPWVQAALQEGRLSERERASLGFIAALLRWNARFYIEIEEAPQRIAVGEFDIEIEGGQP